MGTERKQSTFTYKKRTEKLTLQKNIVELLQAIHEKANGKKIECRIILPRIENDDASSGKQNKAIRKSMVKALQRMIKEAMKNHNEGIQKSRKDDAEQKAMDVEQNLLLFGVHSGKDNKGRGGWRKFRKTCRLA